MESKFQKWLELLWIAGITGFALFIVLGLLYQVVFHYEGSYP